MSSAAQLALGWVEQGLVPDAMIRAAIRRLVRRRLVEIGASEVERAAAMQSAFIDELVKAPIAPLPDKANEQHYELPAAFFAHVLGRRQKYSSCLWAPGVQTLDEAEAAALHETCSRTGLADGQRILELGCGWGSLTLWMAERLPRARITAISNSRAQREHIEAETARRGLRNVQVLTRDVNTLTLDQRFDRIVSVEMFEHARNWRELFRRVSGWLEPDGRFLLHVFVHRTTPYAFVERDESDWMSRHFFSGGMMPSDDLALHFQDHLRLAQRWRWDGTHYQRTANAWLANMDACRDVLRPVIEQAYGAAQADLWWTRWRIFFMSCAELFGHERGQQWFVSHYLFERRDA